PASNQYQRQKEGLLVAEPAATRSEYRSGIPQQANYGSHAGSPFRKPSAALKEQQQKPIVQRRLVVVVSSVEGGGNVVSTQVHLQRYQRPDGLIIDEG